ASFELTTNRVTRSLRCNKNDVDALGCLDVAEANVEAVREGKRLARGQLVLDRVCVNGALVLVWGEDHDEIRPLGCVGDILHRKASLFSLADRLRAFLPRDDALDTRIAKVHCVRVPLRAVADDGHLLALDDREV